MKKLYFIISLILASYILHMFGPWWIPAISALVLGFIFKEHSVSLSFALGFLSLFLLWASWSFYSDSLNDGILSSKIGELFGGLGSISLVLITGLLGGLLGGLGSMTGNLLARANK